MSSRPILAPFPVITNGSMSGDLVSSPTVIQNTSFIGYDIAWTGTPVGTFSVEVSNTYSQNQDGTVRNAGNWTSLTLSTTVAAAGTPDNGFIDIRGISAYAIRLNYTKGSGAGTLNATLSGKVA